MDNNAQNLTNAQNQPQTPPAGPPPRPPLPGPAQMGAAPRPQTPPTPTTSTMPNLGPSRPAATGPVTTANPSPIPGAAAPAVPGFGPGAANTAPAAPGTLVPGAPAAPGAPGAPAAPGAAPVQPGNPNAPAAAPAAPKAKDPAKNKKLTYIILGVVAALVVVICIVVAVIMLKPADKSNPGPVADNPPAETEDDDSLTPITDLDKDGLLSALDNMLTEGYAPAGFFPEEVTKFVSDGYQLSLYDSFERMDEVDDFGLFESAVEVTPFFDNTAAVITAQDDTSEQKIAYISFDVNYLDYSTENSSFSFTSQAPFVYGAEADKEYIEKTLTTVIGACYPQILPIIYSYNIESSDTEAVLTLDAINLELGYGDTASVQNSSDTALADANPSNPHASQVNLTEARTYTESDSELESESDIESDTITPSDNGTTGQSTTSYKISALEMKLAVDFSTGEIEPVTFDDGEDTQTLSTFPLTADEAKGRYQKLLSILMGSYFNY